MPYLSYYLRIIFFYSLLLAIAPQVIATPCSKGCLACNSSSFRCAACDNGYQLTDGGRCLKTDGSYNCDVFLGNSQLCLKCKPTYRMSSGSCFKDYSGCLQYSNNSCTFCGYGTVLTNGSCSGILNCKSYDPECKFCEPGYILNSNRCFYVQRDCVRVDVQSGACQTCALGLKLVGFSCINASTQIPNCNIYNQSGCLMCKPGFGLKDSKCVVIPICRSLQFVNDDFRCEGLPIGCKQVDISSKNCLSCFPNYIMSNYTCEPTLPTHCLNLSHLGLCLSCSHRYYPHQFQCKSVSKYCQAYNFNGRCLNCSYNYFVNYGGICRDPYCLNSTLDSCLQCRQLYRYDSVAGRCLIADPRCVNASDIVCYNCSSGYYASSDVCIQLPVNCLRADRKGACLKCRKNYFRQFDQCYLIQQTIQHCIMYDQYSYISRCVTCQVGYFVSLGQCKQIPAFCSLLLSSGQCAICANGFQLDGNKCVSIKGQTVDVNCALKNNNECVRCASGYALGANSICYLYSSQCKTYDEEAACTECPDGLILSRAACLLISLVDINCKVYSGAICSQCYAGYYLSGNACKLPNADCKHYDPSNGGCTACFPGYSLTNRQCIVVTKIQNCLAYDGKGNCLRCAKFFYLDKLKCVRVNPLCKSYDELTGACKSCFSGFQLQEGSCMQRSKVSYYDYAIETVVTVDTCQEYNKQTGTCKVCISGYFLQDSKCINFASLKGADQTCKIYLNLTYCQECFSGYFVLEGECKAIDPLCRTVDQATGDCNSCYQGYTLSLGSCSIQGGQQRDPCVQKEPDSTCLECSIGYTLNSGRCIFNESQISSFDIPFCQIAANQSFCSLCSNGFYARNGTCYQVSSSCQNYDPKTGECLTCKDSYIFSKGTCIFPALGIDPYCQVYSGVYCSKCVGGYYLNNYMCTKIDVHCLEFNFDVNQCLRCSSGVPLFASCQS